MREQALRLLLEKHLGIMRAYQGLRPGLLRRIDKDDLKPAIGLSAQCVQTSGKRACGIVARDYD
jgi:hypothetical protein